jgi:hypothetical protein
MEERPIWFWRPGQGVWDQLGNIFLNLLCHLFSLKVLQHSPQCTASIEHANGLISAYGHLGLRKKMERARSTFFERGPLFF